MDTNDLISKLSDDLEPVRPTASVQKSSFYWIIASGILVLGSILLFATIRPDILKQLNTPAFIAENISILLAMALGIIAAFRLSVPQPKIDLHTKLLIITSTMIWAFKITHTFLQTEQLTFLHSETACLIDLALIATLPAGFVLFSLRRAATTHSFWTGYAGIMAATSLAALVMRYICPVDSAAHLFIWHFLPVIVLTSLGAFLARILLRW